LGIKEGGEGGGNIRRKAEGGKGGKWRKEKEKD
jgi:hypothetical protein